MDACSCKEQQEIEKQFTRKGFRIISYYPRRMATHSRKKQIHHVQLGIKSLSQCLVCTLCNQPTFTSYLLFGGFVPVMLKFSHLTTQPR